MRRSHRAAYTAVLGLLCALPAAVCAQEQSKSALSSVVMVGSRVRLHSSAVQGQIRGLVVALDQSTMTVATDGGVPMKVPVTAVTSLEASLGKYRKTLKGLVIGTGSGLALGAILPVDPDDCGVYSEYNSCSRGEALLSSTMGGAMVGAMVGFFIKRDRWSTVSLSPVLPQGQNGERSLGFTARLRL